MTSYLKRGTWVVSARNPDNNNALEPVDMADVVLITQAGSDKASITMQDGRRLVYIGANALMRELQKVGKWPRGLTVSQLAGQGVDPLA